MDTARNEIINLVGKIPDQHIPTLRKMLEALITDAPMTDEQYIEFLKQAPEDDEEWTEEDERDIEEAPKEVAEGKVISLEDCARKYGYVN